MANVDNKTVALLEAQMADGKAVLKMTDAAGQTSVVSIAETTVDGVDVFLSSGNHTLVHHEGNSSERIGGIDAQGELFVVETCVGQWRDVKAERVVLLPTAYEGMLVGVVDGATGASRRQKQNSGEQERAEGRGRTERHDLFLWMDGRRSG